MANLLETIKSGCKCDKTGLVIDGETVEARRYDVDSVALSRLYVLRQLELIDQGLWTVKDGVIDGVKYTRKEWRIKSKSAATGGLSKRQCGFDPSPLERKYMEKIGRTHRIYAHHEHCKNAAIGTELQDIVFGPNGSYVNNSNLYNNDTFVMALLDAQVRAIKKTAILGIYKGNDDLAAHFDGALALFVRQANAEYFHTIRYDFADFDSEVEAIFVRQAGTEATIATVEDFVDWVAGLKDYNGDLLYTVYLASDGTTVEITANKVGYAINIHVVLMAASASVDWTCAEEMTFTTLQNRMPFLESPLKLAYETITANNFVTKMFEYQKLWLAHLDPDVDYSGLQAYMAIDPAILQTDAVQALLEFNKYAFGFQLKDKKGLDQFAWTFVPVESLRNSGLFFITFPGNIEVQTNSLNPGDGLKTGVDEKCDTAWAKTDMLANVVVHNFGEVASNVFDSPFATEVLKTEAFVPENIPALCPVARENCLAVSVNDVANFTYEIDGTDITFEDITLPPAGLTISSRAWSIEGNDNPSTVVSGGTSASGTASLGSLTGGVLKLTVTFSNGATDTAYKPFTVS